MATIRCDDRANSPLDDWATSNWATPTKLAANNRQLLGPLYLRDLGDTVTGRSGYCTWALVRTRESGYMTLERCLLVSNRHAIAGTFLKKQKAQ